MSWASRKTGSGQLHHDSLHKFQDGKSGKSDVILAILHPEVKDLATVL